MKIRRLAALCLLLALTAGCGMQKADTQFFAMNTLMYIQAEGADAKKAVEKAEAYINEMDRRLSRTRPESEIFQLNHAGGEWVAVSDETYALIARAKELAAATGGAYDPTVAPLTDLWGIGTDDARIPTQHEIEEALARVDYRNIELAPGADAEAGGRVRLLNGAEIDLGGIAKGGAGAWALTPQDASAALLSLGGNVSAFQLDKDAKPFKIGVGDPDNVVEYLMTVEITDACVVTTGDYERYFEQDGVRYHHVFDPKTGYPARTGLRSVTAVQPYEAGAAADGYATALFVMGLEKGMAFCNQNGIPAIFITEDKRMIRTDAMKEAQGGWFAAGEFTGADQGYVYEE